MSQFFVTGIGTEIGKTFVSSVILRAWRNQGKDVAAVKPVMSGFPDDELVASDGGVLLQAMGMPVNEATLAKVCLHRFSDPIAPNIALRQAGFAEPYPGILDFTRAKMSEGDGKALLVEGAGGVMSPLTDDKLQLDFMIDLGLPVLLVAASYLGAISHTLSALHVLDATGLEVKAIIISQYASDLPNPEAFITELSRWRKDIMIPLAYDGTLEVEKL